MGYWDAQIEASTLAYWRDRAGQVLRDTLADPPPAVPPIDDPAAFNNVPRSPAVDDDGRILPIETPYSGYVLRSRLEARWAVALDALQVRWVYEPQAFDLPSGRYLPDFFLVNQQWWLEIKPFEPDGLALAKARELRTVTRQSVLVAAGPPSVDLRLTVHRATGGTRVTPIGECPQCTGHLILDEGRPCPNCGSPWADTWRYGVTLTRAYHAALRARFD